MVAGLGLKCGEEDFAGVTDGSCLDHQLLFTMFLDILCVCAWVGGRGCVCGGGGGRGGGGSCVCVGFV